MKDYALIFGLAFVLWTWINLFSRRKKRQNIIQKEMKTLTLKRFKNKIRFDENQIRETMDLKKIGICSRTFGNSKMNAFSGLEEKYQPIESISIHKNMNIDFLRTKLKKAEIKGAALKNFKVLVIGLILLWSCFMFYDLYRDFSLKENIDHFRWVMFNIKINFASGIHI